MKPKVMKKKDAVTTTVSVGVFFGMILRFLNVKLAFYRFWLVS